MRQAHFATIEEMEVRHEAQLLEEQQVAANAASLSRITALAELRKSEAHEAMAGSLKAATLRETRDGHEATQAK
eukprot:594963-Heterocapsa_arctica.AAC.1